MVREGVARLPRTVVMPMQTATHVPAGFATYTTANFVQTEEDAAGIKTVLDHGHWVRTERGTGEAASRNFGCVHHESFRRVAWRWSPAEYTPREWDDVVEMPCNKHLS